MRASATVPRTTTSASGSRDHTARVANARWVLGEVKKDRAAWGVTFDLPPDLERFFAQTDRAAAEELRALENPSVKQLAAAAAANHRLTAELGRTKRYGTSILLAHGTRAQVVPEILRTANYDGIFDLTNPRDTPTLGRADCTRILAKGPLLTTREVDALANPGFGEVALLYDPARLDPSRLREARGTDYNNHWTYAVAFPNTALVAIQLLAPVDSGTLARMKEAIAARGLAVPVVGRAGRSWQIL